MRQCGIDFSSVLDRTFYSSRRKSRARQAVCPGPSIAFVTGTTVSGPRCTSGSGCGPPWDRCSREPASRTTPAKVRFTGPALSRGQTQRVVESIFAQSVRPSAAPPVVTWKLFLGTKGGAATSVVQRVSQIMQIRCKHASVRRCAQCSDLRKSGRASSESNAHTYCPSSEDSSIP